MTITIKHIAKLAGVSRGTVDRALNGRAGVKKEVAQRILEIANTLDYKPNKVAKAFANRNRASKIGVVINSEGNPFFDEVLRGIACSAEQIADFGVQVVVKTTQGYDVGRQLELIDELAAENISLLAITPIDDQAISARLNSLIAVGIQVVALNTDITSVDRLAYIGCDYEQSGRTAAGLLGMITGGRANVGVITGSLKILGHYLRVQGFRQTIAGEYPGIKELGLIENNDNDELSYRLVKALIVNNPEISALYFSTAGIEGGIQAVCDLGYAKKVRIITVDLTPAVEKFLRQDIVAATICQEPFRQGYEAINILFDYLITGERPVSGVVNTETKIVLKYNIT